VSWIRGIIGATAGAAVAGIVLRVRVASQERDRSIVETIVDLPTILAQDATHVAASARLAAHDGRVATERARIAFDEQVAAHARRTKGNDD